MNVRQQIDPSTTHGLDLSEFSRGLYINGTWHASRSGRVIAVTDPSTGKIIASVPDAALEDAAAAVAAASAAAEGWRETAPRKRSMRPT